MVWYDMIRYIAVRYGMRRYDTIRYGTIQCYTIRYDMARHGTIRYGAIQYCTICGTIGYEMLRCDTIYTTNEAHMKLGGQAPVIGVDIDFSRGARPT